MNIEKLSENIATSRMTKPTLTKQPVAKEDKVKLSKKDSVDTSDLSQLISISIPDLKAANAVRTDKIKQFSAQMDSQKAIPEKVINTIFSRLVSM
jgi:hypothetical protein